MANYALLVASDPGQVGTILNALEYALTLEEADHEVRIYLDGAATKLPDEIEHRIDHPLSERFDEVGDRELLAGACAFCAAAHGGTDGCREAEIPLVGTAGEAHGPDVAGLVAEGYELLTIT